MSPILSEKPNKMDEVEKLSSGSTDDHIDRVTHLGRIEDDMPLDFDDPHRAALEDNPEHAKTFTVSTALAVLFLAMSPLASLGISFALTSAILQQLGTELGSTDNIAWIVGAFTITSSVTFSISGATSDVFGRRWTIIAGDIFALIAAIVGATAQTTNTIVAVMAISGVGCGFTFVSYAGISEILPNKWRPAGLALPEIFLAVPWSCASVIIANLLNTRTAAGWRWIYYLAIIFAVVCAIGTFLFYFPPAKPQHDFEKTRWQEVKELDFIGIILFTIGLTVLLVGLTWAGTTGHPWSSASVIAPIVLGVCTLGACFAYDFIVPTRPFFPLVLFRQFRQFTVVVIASFVSGMFFYPMTGLLPQASLFIFTNDPIQIGLIELPEGVGLIVFGPVIAFFVGKTGHMKIAFLVALTVMTLFTGLLAATIPGNKAAWMALQAFAIGPYALTTVLAYTIVSLHIPLRHLGLAYGVIGTFRSAGGSVGNAILNTILTGVVNVQLPKRITAAALGNGVSPQLLPAIILAAIENAAGVPGAFSTIPNMTPVLEAALARAVKEAYAHAFRMVFYSMIPFGVLGIVAACFIRDSSQYLTNHTAIHLEKEGVLRQVGGNHEGGKQVEIVHSLQDKV